MLILDFYVDEPACFGVPPYLSPYCRYVAGALVQGGIAQSQIRYMTVDQWRAAGKSLDYEPELVVLIAGASVPGKYLGGKIGTIGEIHEFLTWQKHNNPRGLSLLGGPIRYAAPEIRQSLREAGGALVVGDVELYAYHLAQHAGQMRSWLQNYQASKHSSLGERRHYTDQVDLWAPAGAFISNLHPNFPWLILEIESYRGCTRDIFCSFCTEAWYGRPEFRSIASIASEVAELAAKGCRFYRLGRQADLMTYLPDMQDFQNSFPRPRPASLLGLYQAIHQACPNLKLLHLDNINPGLIATFPGESREILKIICDYNTTGDTAAMGIESVDPVVIQKNDLKCDAAEALRAIEMVNEFGARRHKGVPRLLPGLNLIQGLPGENRDTFKMNYEFLKSVMDQGLLLRRINIRQAVSFENTKLGRQNKSTSGRPHKTDSKMSILDNRFRYFRDLIRKEVDQPMLALNFPLATVLDHVLLEARNQGYFLGRQLGSYPVTVKIPDDDPQASALWFQIQEHQQPARPLSVIVTGYEERSLRALSYPIQINRLGQKSLRSLPGVGKRRASQLFTRRPLSSPEELEQILEQKLFAEAGAFNWQNELSIV